MDMLIFFSSKLSHSLLHNVLESIYGSIFLNLLRYNLEFYSSVEGLTSDYVCTLVSVCS